MARHQYLTYLKGVPFIVEADVVEVSGVLIPRQMEVQIEFELPDGVVGEKDAVYYMPLPDLLLDECYVGQSSTAPTLREHFRTEVLSRALSINGHLDD